MPCFRRAIDILNLFVHVPWGWHSPIMAVSTDTHWYGHREMVCSGRGFFGSAFCMSRDIFLL